MARLGKTPKVHESHPSKASKVFGDSFKAGEPMAFQHAIDMMKVEAPSLMTVLWMVLSLMIT